MLNTWLLQICVLNFIYSHNVSTVPTTFVVIGFHRFFTPWHRVTVRAFLISYETSPSNTGANSNYCSAIDLWLAQRRTAKRCAPSSSRVGSYIVRLDSPLVHEALPYLLSSFGYTKSKTKRPALLTQRWIFEVGHNRYLGMRLRGETSRGKKIRSSALVADRVNFANGDGPCLACSGRLN